MTLVRNSKLETRNSHKTRSADPALGSAALTLALAPGWVKRKDAAGVEAVSRLGYKIKGALSNLQAADPKAGCALPAVALISVLSLLIVAASPIRARSSPQAQDTLLSQAAELARNKDYAGAEKAYRQALLTAPDDPEILKALGMVFQAEAKYPESIEVFQTILKRAPLYPGVNSLLGVSYYALKNFEKTIEATQNELTGNPKDRQARHYLALALSASGRIFEAIQQLEGLRADNPQDVEVLYQLVVDYRAATQQAGERLARLYPESEFTHAVDGEVYADNGRLDEAVLEFKDVLAKNPNFPSIHFALGQAYWRKRDSENATEQLKLALQEDPNQPMANYYLGDILTDRKEYLQAIPRLRIAIGAYPEMAQAYFLLGKCYAGAGESPRALEAFNKALNLDPNYKEVHYQLHELYARLGEPAKSQAHLQTFERLVKEGQDKDKRLLEESAQRQIEAKTHN
jgi:tetratricopeptide (TPR) repeat protein